MGMKKTSEYWDMRDMNAETLMLLASSQMTLMDKALTITLGCDTPTEEHLDENGKLKPEIQAEVAEALLEISTRFVNHVNDLIEMKGMLGDSCRCSHDDDEQKYVPARNPVADRMYG